MAFRQGEAAERRNQMLMIDARNIFRKVTRKIYDFSLEQLQNLSAIVWLYRGQTNRFLNLARSYIERLSIETEIIPSTLGAFDAILRTGREGFEAFAKNAQELDAIPREKAALDRCSF